MATRDYKTPERTRPNRPRRGGSGFFWFVTGAVVGAFGVGLAWMLQDRITPPVTASPQTQAKPPTKPSFVFHQLLPEMEVVVPDEELNVAPPPLPTPPPRQPQESASPQPSSPIPVQTTKAEQAEGPSADGASYLVQVASFREASDAEQLKARLALLGVQARIQQVTVDGKSYHRVRAGPYKGKQKVNDTRALLGKNGFESIVIKLK